MIKHTDEILLPVLESDGTAVPRYNIRDAGGNIIAQNATLELANGIAQEGTPVNKPLLDEFLAASGVTAGTATAYTLAQEGYALFNGAFIRFQLHAASGANATLNINGTGAKPLKDVLGEAMPDGIPAGAWLTANYSAAADAYIIAGGGTGNAEELINAHKTESGAHSAADITETTAKQFVTAAEKTKWNALEPGGVVLFNQRLTSTTASVVLNLPTDYNYFRIVLANIMLSDTSMGILTIDCEDATTHFYGVGIGDNGDETAAILVSDISAVFNTVYYDNYTTGSIVLDAQRVSNGIRGQLVAVNDSGDAEGAQAVYIGSWFATQSGVSEMTISVSGGYGMKTGTSIMVMGVK